MVGPLVVAKSEEGALKFYKYKDSATGSTGRRLSYLCLAIKDGGSGMVFRKRMAAVVRGLEFMAG
jgi:hypothetical protein